jgi:tetratricopeptide (TPR) repeat protein
MNEDKKLLEDADKLVAQIPKPDLQIRLALAKALFASPEECLSFTKEGLRLATSLKLKPLEASLLLRKAQALFQLERLEEAKETIDRTLTYNASIISPAEIYFTAYQIYEALKDAKAKNYLEEAQNWIDQTAKVLPKDLRRTFLNQTLHKKIL